MTTCRRVLLCISVFFLAFSAGAQIIIEDEITTDTVDVLSHQERTDNPPRITALGSAVLPGLGQHYLNQRRKALGFLSVEAAFLFGLIYSEGYSRRQFEGSRSYAWTHAGIQGGARTTDFFWQQVGAFMDTDEYNAAVELDRAQDTELEKYTSDNLQWRWADDSFRKEYLRRRETAARYHVASTFFLAFMVANRVISFIDARVAIAKGASEPRISVVPSLDPAGPGLSLSIQTGF